jgi:hypothetical protein
VRAVINVVDIPEPGSVADPFQLGLLLPVPGPDTNTIMLEQRDGPNVVRLTAVAIAFNVEGRAAFNDKKVLIDVLVTDARVAVACSKYDKGDSWLFFGGSALDIFNDALFNSVSTARAHIRSRGKMLVGQIRYPWIQRIGGSSEEGKLVFETSAGRGGQMRLTLVLSKGPGGLDVATEIARRAASYRLASEQLGQDASRWLEALTAAEPDGASAPDSGGMRFFQLPEPRRVSTESALLAPRVAGEQA